VNFTEFQGYAEFSNTVENTKLKKSGNELKKWIHDTFDNRLVIVDEAHNLRDTSESEASKLVGIALETILKTATGVTLVLLNCHANVRYIRRDRVLPRTFSCGTIGV